MHPHTWICLILKPWVTFSKVVRCFTTMAEFIGIDSVQSVKQLHAGLSLSA